MKYRDGETPLNEFIEEEIEVPSFTPKFFGDKIVGVEKTTKKMLQKTMFLRTSDRSICVQHTVVPQDIHKHTFRCIKCPWIIRAVPGKQKYDPINRHLLDRKTLLPL